MAKSLEQIQSQIDKLQREADRIRQREKSETVDRIKQAIAFYDITSEELFGATRRGRKSAKAEGGAEAPATKTRARRGSKTAGRTVKPKFVDENGNHWSGRGLKPRWLTAALAEGKSLEDFRVKD